MRYFCLSYNHSFFLISCSHKGCGYSWFSYWVTFNCWEYWKCIGWNSTISYIRWGKCGITWDWWQCCTIEATGSMWVLPQFCYDDEDGYWASLNGEDPRDSCSGIGSRWRNWAWAEWRKYREGNFFASYGNDCSVYGISFCTKVPLKLDGICDSFALWWLQWKNSAFCLSIVIIPRRENRKNEQKNLMWWRIC